jgi:Tol biopolymer transport system component
MLRRFGLAATLILAAPSALAAQYFGQNRVQYTKFNFEVIKTEHFDIYFYERERAAAMDAGRIAERAYGRLSRILNHEFKERKPIILYASHSDFQQTNALGGDIGEGTGGVTDFLKHRAIMPFTGSYRDFEHVLMHEMVHQFQYDTWARGRAGAGLSTIIAVNPPLWFAEGMAEYLSLGGITPETAMWLRDATLEGKLPTIEQLTNDPYIFPYRFGHAIWSYIGARWGDEAVGAILQGTLSGGLDASFRRVLGLSLQQLSTQWRDDVQREYLPDVAARQRARGVGAPLLTKELSGGTLHVAPALSPDGSLIAYLSERNFYFVDFYLADGRTGKVIRKLAKSVFDANYETFRYLSSSASWSPDSRFLVFAAKAKARDDIVIFDVNKGRAARRIKVDLNGVTSPVFSPDGSQIVFSGQDGGISDLFIVNLNGTGFRRLTDDKFADLQPAWSPDGKTVAYVTDEGPNTDFETLRFGNLRIALYHLDTDTREVLPFMDEGRNISPQWAPDGKSLAFVSDRTGAANIFLYEVGGEIYQLTDFFTGAQSATPLSPALSWAQKADRLAFVYYEQQNNDVYSITNPRALKRDPYRPAAARPEAAPVAQVQLPSPADTAQAPAPVPQAREGGSIYKAPSGFRAAGQAPVRADSAGKTIEPLSIARLLDSATLDLPDSAEFTVVPYKKHYTPETVARPSIGYTRDNFGNGIYGGGAIQLSDMLGNNSMIFAAYVNGRINEGEFLGAYVDVSNRFNWAAGFQQRPQFYLEGTAVIPNEPTPGEYTYVTQIRRLIFREVFGRAYYPINRFRRLEFGLTAANIDDASQLILEPFDPVTGFPTREPQEVTTYRPGVNNITPALAMVFDNSLFGWTGPFLGQRYRLEISQTMGGWNYMTGLADYRRYDKVVGPLVFATRALWVGRTGPEADNYLYFLGTTELLRGNTSGSYERNECQFLNDPGTQTGCVELDRLLGTNMAVANAEIRFPILTPSMGTPASLPPIEGALFFDYGVAWDEHSTIKFKREPGDDPINVRTPSATIGVSARMNLLGFMILRADWSAPQGRGIKPYWTISLGPTY